MNGRMPADTLHSFIKDTSAIVTGKASYFSHERDYSKDLEAIASAFEDALNKALKWVGEYKTDHKYSAKVYETMYLKPAHASHIPHKAGVNEYIFKQRVRVFISEVTKVEPGPVKLHSEWIKKDNQSTVLDPVQGSSLLSVCGTMPCVLYKIVRADGNNLKDTFDNVLMELRKIKEYNNVQDVAANKMISLTKSCDEFVLLGNNENSLEVGVKMTVPYFYEFEKPHLVDIHEAPELMHI